MLFREMLTKSMKYLHNLKTSLTEVNHCTLDITYHVQMKNQIQGSLSNPMKPIQNLAQEWFHPTLILSPIPNTKELVWPNLIDIYNWILVWPNLNKFLNLITSTFSSFRPTSFWLMDDHVKEDYARQNVIIVYQPYT